MGRDPASRTCDQIDFRSSPNTGHSEAHAGLPLLTQAVRKRFSRGRDEIMNQDVGLSRNNDSPTLPSGFNCCAIGLGARVFTQPGPEAEVEAHQRVTRYTPGFNHFVTTMAAPMASGRSDSCRLELAPTEERRLSTAHTQPGHSAEGKFWQMKPKRWKLERLPPTCRMKRPRTG